MHDSKRVLRHLEAQQRRKASKDQKKADQQTSRPAPTLGLDCSKECVLIYLTARSRHDPSEWIMHIFRDLENEEENEIYGWACN
jgi:hypothetical protein